MKRKVEKQQATAAPRSAVSAVAARRARQQQEQHQEQNASTSTGVGKEPPSKKTRSSNVQEPFRPDSSRQSRAETDVQDQTPNPSNVDTTSDAFDEDQVMEENVGVIADQENGIDDAGQDGEEFETPSQLENFTLSRHRLTKKDVVYSDEDMLCVRIKEKTTLVLIGIYDIWVKRGVVSIMGAKLHPSPHVYRVYAPSTHSLPVIKCVSSVEGYAEIELQSCSSNLDRLKEISPLYNRIWNSGETPGDKSTFKGSCKRSFSILYTSSDDPLKRPLRPLHLDKKWSSTIKSLSQRGHGLKALVCGPKGAGKSTFGRYLLNHLLSPAPQTDKGPGSPDGVAYLDLDPGQPEFAPMGNIYLAHLREPFFGPPFSHSTLENSRHGTMIRCHHIGATSPKEDSDHYALATMNLLDQYRVLQATYPQCPLIINFPGWIFGLGLEVVTWLIRTMGLSDVIYMSEKGPDEVVQSLRYASSEANVALTTLPSQPIDFVSRSSAQFRSMQMQSYFHASQPNGLQNPFWSSAPLAYHKPVCVSYAGEKQGIRGIMVLGNRHDPAVLKDILDGSVVSVVAIEDASAIDSGQEPGNNGQDEEKLEEGDGSVEMQDAQDHQNTQRLKNALDTHIVRCQHTSLPYLFCGAGSCTPLNPKASRSLGLALVRAVNTDTHHLELTTPIPSARIREALDLGQCLVLARGMLDSPDWAISEEFHAARNAEQDYLSSLALAKKRGQEEGSSEPEQARQRDMLQRLRGRVKRASRAPWMSVVEDAGPRQVQDRSAQQTEGIWKLRKKAYIGSDSEPEW
ncbi:Polynucleotide 5'-hydroxyl-kinase grc3 [Talaromyces islandicus]|uniref:Polynucleotide 5'-hydroxyl-kinase GRC3 n=1 Tax=Talaromyces islandicus TaxID=28573 RepID=A0A0U1LQN4_TALIS|nr:Polynucleotide 5'-hydroxyl-kinase grc3 [Talaromyces islandicus]